MKVFIIAVEFVYSHYDGRPPTAVLSFAPVTVRDARVTGTCVEIHVGNWPRVDRTLCNR